MFVFEVRSFKTDSHIPNAIIFFPPCAVLNAHRNAKLNANSSLVMAESGNGAAEHALASQMGFSRSVLWDSCFLRPSRLT